MAFGFQSVILNLTPADYLKQKQKEKREKEKDKLKNNKQFVLPW